jgi:hypothetical protein
MELESKLYDEIKKVRETKGILNEKISEIEVKLENQIRALIDDLGINEELSFDLTIDNECIFLGMYGLDNHEQMSRLTMSELGMINQIVTGRELAPCFIYSQSSRNICIEWRWG